MRISHNALHNAMFGTPTRIALGERLRRTAYAQLTLALQLALFTAVADILDFACYVSKGLALALIGLSAVAALVCWRDRKLYARMMTLQSLLSAATCLLHIRLISREAHRPKFGGFFGLAVPLVLHGATALLAVAGTWFATRELSDAKKARAARVEARRTAAAAAAGKTKAQ